MVRTVVILALLGSLSALELAPPFRDHAVLQRGKPVPVWGRAEPAERITVRFAGQEKTSITDAEGLWRVDLDTMEASSQGRELIASGRTTIRIDDVVVGEVWICSGQSNMERALSFSLGASEDIAAADLPRIRHLKIPWKSSAVPLRTVENAAWTRCSPKTAGDFTAVGFYAARDLEAALELPIGIISCNWSGSNIEPWIPPAGFRAVPALKEMAAAIDAADPATDAGARNQRAFLDQMQAWLPTAEAALAARRPLPAMPTAPGPSDNRTRNFNGMVHPLLPYALRGILWYQGESNGNEGPSYFSKMQALILGWRQAFGQGEIPVYFVQLANHQKSDPAKPEGGDGWAKLREAQRAALVIPGTGMAVAIDIGDATDIHPRNKADVGNRLARWALARDYGKQVVPSGPLYRAHTITGSTMIIEFDHVADGLMAGRKEGRRPVQPTPDARLAWWAIAGTDKVWQPAEAVIRGDRVVVNSPRVTAPVAVRYAFAMNPDGANLYNSAGLPASPFRTDSW